MTTKTKHSQEAIAAAVASIPWAEMELVAPGCSGGIERADATARAGTVAVALLNGASVAELARIAAAKKASRGASVRVSTRFGALSRGKCWARMGRGQSVEWADKDGGAVMLPAGKWTVGSDDGFSRKEQTEWTVVSIAGVLIAE